LLAALRGETDQELACRLGISLSTVKKTWLPIYEQISNHLLMFLSDRFAAQEGGEHGGKKAAITRLPLQTPGRATSRSSLEHPWRVAVGRLQKMVYEILASGNH
jgi:hypothetical protein